MSDTCPKCGMNLPCWAAVMQHVDSPFCIELQLRIMTARAEKAEAELISHKYTDKIEYVAAWPPPAPCHICFKRIEACTCHTDMSDIRRSLAEAKLSAEKAEAEVIRLRDAVGLRDRLRYEYVEETNETLAKRCRWCGRMERDGCDPRICPTVTNPAEGRP